MKILKLSDEQIECLKPFVEKNQDAQVAFDRAAYLIKQTNFDIWKIIGEMFPGEITNGGNLFWNEKYILLKGEYDENKKNKM